MRDLGLSYEAAAHGVQSAIRFEMTKLGFADDEQDKIVHMLKHQRCGLDLSKSDMQGLAELLIAKRVFTLEEYVEAMRRGANEELARYQDHLRKEYGLSGATEFR